jgi:hypothetical protein
MPVPAVMLAGARRAIEAIAARTRQLSTQEP